MAGKSIRSETEHIFYTKLCRTVDVTVCLYVYDAPAYRIQTPIDENELRLIE